MLRHVIEGQLDLEAVVVDAQVPVLVLQHDRHLARVARGDLLGEFHAGRTGVEGNVEMVLTRQPLRLGNAQRLADDTLQGILGEQVIAHQVIGHAGRSGVSVCRGLAG